MCGYPIALSSRRSLPSPRRSRARRGRRQARYRTDLIVRATRRSHARGQLRRAPPAGRWRTRTRFNAFRTTCLPTAVRPAALYREMVVVELITARNVDRQRARGRIDVGPLDAYWHLLIARHRPELTCGRAVLASTATAPIPPSCRGRHARGRCARLRTAFVAPGPRGRRGPGLPPLALRSCSRLRGRDGRDVCDDARVDRERRRPVLRPARLRAPRPAPAGLSPRSRRDPSGRMRQPVVAAEQVAPRDVRNR